MHDLVTAGNRIGWYRALLALAPVLMVPASAQTASLELLSPDGQVAVTVATRDFGEAKAGLDYRVNYRGKPALLPSRFSLDMEGGVFGQNLRITRQERQTHDATWQPVCGERSAVRDHYNQLTLELQESAAPNRTLQLTFRAYNAGAAFCYTMPEQKGLTNAVINREITEFCFAGDHPAWAVYSAQGKYAKVNLSSVKAGCERPLVLELPEHRFAAISEARLVDFARMKFDLLKGKSNALVSALSSKVEMALPFRSPWRAIMVAESPGQLLENNDLILNLNDPCALGDTSWIKPGKVIREVTLTTAGGKACVDFAVKRGLQFVEYDAGWYGPENSDASDARSANVDPQRSKGPLDLAEVINYAKERGIGIILYVNHKALERQMDELFPLYEKWGVKGIKFGFVNVGSQQWTAWTHEGIRKAAQHHLMVDIHDEYRTTGYSRTYPNLMTVEGIAGDETSPPNTLTLAILFTRMLTGPADNTVCYYDTRVSRNASHAYQLAKPVCLFSPWQFLFWYDRPPAAPQRVGGAGGAETQIGNDPELEFYNKMPTTWDDTKIIHGQIGEYAVIARRKGADWFIGYMNSGQARTLEIPLAFLPPGVKYVASIYSDDLSLATKTKVKIERFLVNAQTTLKCSASAQGGQAIHLRPAAANEPMPFYPR